MKLGKQDLHSDAIALWPLLAKRITASGLGGGNILEGPGIDVVTVGSNNTVGLGGDTILLYDSGGAPVAEYAADATGLDAALAAASSGDVVQLPAKTISGAHTIPASVAVVGMGGNSILSGAITNNGLLIFVEISGTLANNGTCWIIDPTNHYIGINGKPTEQLEIFGDTTDYARGPMQITGLAGTNPTGTGFSLNGEAYGGITWSFISTGTKAGFPPYALGAGALGFYDTTAGIYRMIILPSGHISIGPESNLDLAHLAVVQVADVIGQVIRGSGGQTANLQQWQASGGAVLVAIAASGQIISNLATGTAPLDVDSTTLVTNFNADLLDGSHASAFAAASHSHTAADIDSQTAIDGYVLTADGLGGADWEVPSGGTMNFDAILVDDSGSILIDDAGYVLAGA